MNAGETVGEFVAAEPDEKSDDKQKDAAEHEGIFPVALAGAKDEDGEEDHLGAESEHATARTGEEDAGGHDGGDAGNDEAAIAVGEATDGPDQREGSEQFHEAGVMIVVYVGAVDCAALGGGPNPVELSVGGHALENGEGRDDGSVGGDCGEERIKLRGTSERLSGDEGEHSVGGIEKEAGVGGVAIGAHASQPLHEGERKKCGHGGEEGVRIDDPGLKGPLTNSPDDEEKSGARFEGEDGPGLNRAEGERREQEYRAGSGEKGGVRKLCGGSLGDRRGFRLECDGSTHDLSSLESPMESALVEAGDSSGES